MKICKVCMSGPQSGPHGPSLSVCPSGPQSVEKSNQNQWIIMEKSWKKYAKSVCLGSSRDPMAPVCVSVRQGPILLQIQTQINEQSWKTHGKIMQSLYVWAPVGAPWPQSVCLSVCPSELQSVGKSNQNQWKIMEKSWKNYAKSVCLGPSRGPMAPVCLSVWAPVWPMAPEIIFLIVSNF